MTDQNLKIKKYFELAIKHGNLSHAYLFSGLEGAGKGEFAQDLFKLINGRSCQNDPDFKLISPRIESGESKIYIEDMRDFKSFLSFKPYYGPYKFVIIDNADRLTVEASNAILKSLEEPPPSSIIIMISSRPNLILPTILSRCEEINFLSIGKRSVSPNMQPAVEEFLKVSKQGVFEKLEYAKKIYEKGNYSDLISTLIHSADHTQPVRYLRGLLKLHKLISQPQFNHRLALENFLINL